MDSPNMSSNLLQRMARDKETHRRAGNIFIERDFDVRQEAEHFRAIVRALSKLQSYQMLYRESEKLDCLRRTDILPNLMTSIAALTDDASTSSVTERSTSPEHLDQLICATNNYAATVEYAWKYRAMRRVYDTYSFWINDESEIEDAPPEVKRKLILETSTTIKTAMDEADATWNHPEFHLSHCEAYLPQLDRCAQRMESAMGHFLLNVTRLTTTLSMTERFQYWTRGKKARLARAVQLLDECERKPEMSDSSKPTSPHKTIKRLRSEIKRLSAQIEATRRLFHAQQSAENVGRTSEAVALSERLTSAKLDVDAGYHDFVRSVDPRLSWKLRTQGHFIDACERGFVKLFDRVERACERRKDGMADFREMRQGVEMVIGSKDLVHPGHFMEHRQRDAKA